MGLWAAVCAGALWAQGAEEAAARGQQEQQRAQERERSQREALQRGVDVLGATGPIDPVRAWPQDETPCFPIHHIALQGDMAERFQWALAALTQGDDPAMGRCLGVQGLGVAVGRVQQALIEKGYVTTRVLLQPQDLSGGQLTLTLLPGRIGAIRFVEPVPERATAWNAVPARVGDILNLRDIEQALENFKRVPTAEADIQIAPGTEPGQSELHIRWRQGLPLRLNLSVDDGGSRATGRYQGNATLSYDHWWTLNDLFYLTLGRDLGGDPPGVSRGANGTRNASAHYSLPLGYWTVSFDTSRHRYFQRVAGVNQDYVYSGNGAQQGLSLSRLVHRAAASKTTLTFKAFARRSHNFIDDTEIEVQRRRTGGWELQAEHRAYLGRSQLDVQLAYKRGTGAFGSQRAPEEAFGEGSARFALTSLEASWSQPIDLWGQRLQWSSRWRGQREKTPLTPQDRFAIGGRYSVRGFDGESSLAGERGWWWRNELSAPLGSSGQWLYVGVDQGRVGGASAQWLVGRRLAGAVLGLRGGWGALRYDVFVGAPVHKPERFKTAKAHAGFQLSASF